MTANLSKQTIWLIAGPILTYCSFFCLTDVQASSFSAQVHESTWQTESSSVQCSMRHEIPDLGRAIFEQKMGERASFQLHQSLAQPHAGVVSVYVQPAPWAKKKEGHRLVKASYGAGPIPVSMNKHTVYEMLQGLNQGHQLKMVLTPKANLGSPQEVLISPVGFQKAYDIYLGCLEKLVPYKWEELKKSVIDFPSGSFSLDDLDTARLDAIAAVVAQDEYVTKVRIEGHTDAKGNFTANRTLSYQRAWLVKDYLVNRGVKPSLIEVSGMADLKPVAKNKTKEGRAKNRRVEIMISR